MATTLTKALYIMVKFPIEGRVKTRLAKSIGHVAATAIYKSFVEFMVSQLRDHFHLIISYDVFTPLVSYQHWLGHDLHYQAQVDSNLGERINHCFSLGFQNGFKQIVVIGSDAPDVPLLVFNKAFNALKTHDMTLGPTYDGGYYLIGFSKLGYDSSVFEHISWSSQHVYKETRAHVNRLNITCYETLQWYDIDTKSELHYLAQTDNASFLESESFKLILPFT